jgi:hypothetical protein
MAKETLLMKRVTFTAAMKVMATQIVVVLSYLAFCLLLPPQQHESEQSLLPHAIHIPLQLVELDTVTGYISTRPEYSSLLLPRMLRVTPKQLEARVNSYGRRCRAVTMWHIYAKGMTRKHERPGQ